MSTLTIKQVKSANGTDQRQKDTLRTLGLRRSARRSSAPTPRSCAGSSTPCATCLTVEEK